MPSYASQQWMKKNRSDQEGFGFLAPGARCAAKAARAVSQKVVASDHSDSFCASALSGSRSARSFWLIPALQQASASDERVVAGADRCRTH